MISYKRAFGSAALAGALFFGTIGCGGGGSTASFCNLNDDLSGAEFDTENPGAVRDAMNKAKSAAPSEIKEEVTLLADASEALLDASDDPAKLQEISESFDQEKVQAASDKIEAYVAEHCDTDE